MNNKGQSLVLFVILIPIFLGITALVIDVGRTLVEKNSINNKIELIIEYGLEDNLTKDELIKLMDYNLDNYEYKVEITDDVIEINTKTYVKGFISTIINHKGFSIESEYRGFINDNNEKIIKKVK